MIYNLFDITFILNKNLPYHIIIHINYILTTHKNYNKINIHSYKKLKKINIDKDKFNNFSNFLNNILLYIISITLKNLVLKYFKF